MAGTRDSQATGTRHLRLLPSGAQPLPAVVPLLRPDQPITAAQDAMLTGLARRARLGDRAARDLLWRAFAPKLEPALRRCGRLAWQPRWARRDGRPWELDDVRQEAWLAFAALTAEWSGEGSFVPYVVAHFPWRLRSVVRRLGPPRLTVPIATIREPLAEWDDLHDTETLALVAAMVAHLCAADQAVLRLRLTEGASFGEIAMQLGVSRRTIRGRWARIRRVALAVLERG